MESVAPSNGAFVFNYFLRPLKPDFQSALKWWADAGKRIADHHKDDGGYLSTHLHMALDPHSVYEVFNFAVFRDFDCLPFRFGKDPNVIKKIDASQRPPCIFYPGGYKEVAVLTRDSSQDRSGWISPKERRFIAISFAFEADMPKGPPISGPPGRNPVKDEATIKATNELEANWKSLAGADILSAKDFVRAICFYKRATHGVVAFALRAEIDEHESASAAMDELRRHFDGSGGDGCGEFFEKNAISVDVGLYRVVINGGPKGYEENEFGV